jgi:hypothetical protein
MVSETQLEHSAPHKEAAHLYNRKTIAMTNEIPFVITTNDIPVRRRHCLRIIAMQRDLSDLTDNEKNLRRHLMDCLVKCHENADPPYFFHAFLTLPYALIILHFIFFFISFI